MSKTEPLITYLQSTFLWGFPISESETSTSSSPANSIYATFKPCLCVLPIPNHILSPHMASHITSWILPMSSYNPYSEHSQYVLFQRIHTEALEHTELRDCVFKIRTTCLCWGSHCRYYEIGQERIFLKLMCYILIRIPIVQAHICQN